MLGEGSTQGEILGHWAWYSWSERHEEEQLIIDYKWRVAGQVARGGRKRARRG